MKWRSLGNVFRSVRSKIKNLAAEPAAKTDPLLQLISNGNMTLGEHCDISQLTVFSHEFGKNVLNVSIGDNCHLMGQIELYSPNARVTIGDRVFIGPGTKLFCRESIHIESDVLISWGSTLIDTNAHSLKSAERADDVVAWKKGYQHKNWDVVASRPVLIRSKSWIGFNSIITKGVTVGEGTIIASGSVVTKSTGDYNVVGGNPAVVIKSTE